MPIAQTSGASSWRALGKCRNWFSTSRRQGGRQAERAVLVERGGALDPSALVRHRLDRDDRHVELLLAAAFLEHVLERDLVGDGFDADSDRFPAFERSDNAFDLLHDADAFEG